MEKRPRTAAATGSQGSQQPMEQDEGQPQHELKDDNLTTIMIKGLVQSMQRLRVLESICFMTWHLPATSTMIIQGKAAGTAFDEKAREQKGANLGPPHIQVAFQSLQALACDPKAAQSEESKAAAKRMEVKCKFWSQREDGMTVLGRLIPFWTSRAHKPPKTVREQEDYVPRFRLHYTIDLDTTTADAAWQFAVDLVLLIKLQGGEEVIGRAPANPLERALVARIEQKQSGGRKKR